MLGITIKSNILSRLTPKNSLFICHHTKSWSLHHTHVKTNQETLPVKQNQI